MRKTHPSTDGLRRRFLLCSAFLSCSFFLILVYLCAVLTPPASPVTMFKKVLLTTTSMSLNENNSSTVDSAEPFLQNDTTLSNRDEDPGKSHSSNIEKNKNIFDIVYVTSLLEDNSTSPINYTDVLALFQETVKEVTKSTAYSDPDGQTAVRFHLLTNDDKLIEVLSSWYPRLFVHDYRRVAQSARSQEFHRNYIHQSVNAIEYEKLCIWRWLMVGDYFQDFFNKTGEAAVPQENANGKAAINTGIPAHYILGIDTDVVLLQHPRYLLNEWKLQKWVEKEYECHQVVAGAAMIWSPHGLQSFGNFILDMYKTRADAEKHVQEWGQTYPFCRPERSQLIPCKKSQDGKNDTMFHLSDMDLLRAWILQNTTTRTRQQEEQCIVVRQARKYPGFRMVKKHMKEQDNRRVVLGSMLPSHDNKEGSKIAYDYDMEKIVCLVHFQGKSKQLIPSFQAFMEQNDTEASLPSLSYEAEYILP